MSTKETWRPVPSVPGLFASSHGRLMVTPYESAMPKGGARQYGGKPTPGQWGGSRFIYRLRGKTYKVARLVCEAFNGSPQPGQICMHLDEDSRNNHPANLRWGTQKENLNAPGFIAYCKSRTGDANPVVKSIKKRNMTAGKDRQSETHP